MLTYFLNYPFFDFRFGNFIHGESFDEAFSKFGPGIQQAGLGASEHFSNVDRAVGPEASAVLGDVFTKSSVVPDFVSSTGEAATKLTGFGSAVETKEVDDISKVELSLATFDTSANSSPLVFTPTTPDAGNAPQVPLGVDWTKLKEYLPTELPTPDLAEVVGDAPAHGLRAKLLATQETGASSSKTGLASEVGSSTGAPSAFNEDGRLQIMVELASGVGAADINGLMNAFGGELTGTIRFDGGPLGGDVGAILTFTLPANTAFEALQSALVRSPLIERVELDYNVGIAATSDDTYYANGSLWGMMGPADGIGPYDNDYGSRADVAWNMGYTGSSATGAASTTVVGVNDSGIDPTHPDLYLNIWINQDEIPEATYLGLSDTDGNGVITFHDLNHADNAGWVSDSNGNGFIDAMDLLGDTRWEDGVDRDGNGYTDDLFGWNFQDNNNRPFVLSTTDDYIGFGRFVLQETGSHGVHVSGTIGGMGGNEEGVAGVAWDTQIIAMKTFYQGSAPTSYLIAANNYFAELAGRSLDGDLDRSDAYHYVATNNSYVSPEFSQLELDSIVDLAAVDVLHVTAAGNSGENLDANGSAYPAEYTTEGMTATDGTFIDFDSVIAVAAIDSAGNLASFSNYGATSVDIAAPGAAIWSAEAGGGYVLKDGTSMAAPHVTGAVVLYASASPDASASEIKAALLGSAITSDALTGYVLTNGRLDVAGMMASIETTSNADPVITSANANSVEEGTLAAIDVDASDTDGDTLTYAISGGPDAERFTIDAATGLVNFKTAPDYEAPADDGANNVYDIQVTVSDGNGGSAVQDIAITVTDDPADNPVSHDVYGSDSSADMIYGKGGIVSGLSKDGTFNGAGTIDILNGMDDAADTFLFGDTRGVFYDDESNRPGSGGDDYASVVGFEGGLDKLGLLSTSQYFAEFDGTDTSIYLDVWRSGSDNRNELIAVVENVDLTSATEENALDTSYILWTDDLSVA